MHKRNLLTVLGMTAAFVIAFGGWRLTSALLDRQEERLLSGRGETLLVVQEAASPRPSGSGEPSDGLPVEDDRQSRTDSFTGDGSYDGTVMDTVLLSEEEIAAILTNWERREYQSQPHEPFPGQLTMQEAVEIAKEAMSHLYDMGVIPSGSQTGDYTDASLNVWIPYGENITTINPENSLWTVTLSGESTVATFLIHALSGEMWHAEIQFTAAEEYHQYWDVRKLLEEYVQNLNLGEARLINDAEKNVAYCVFEKNIVHAMAAFYPIESTVYGEGTFHLYMGLQAGELNLE